MSNLIPTTVKEILYKSESGPLWQKIGASQHHGIVVPLFSLHSDTSGGIGEYPDLLPLIPWCRECGLDVIQLLPLNDTGLESSPYSALSAFALNPIHLSLMHLPKLMEDSNLKHRVEELTHLNKSQRVAYADIHWNKDGILKDYYHQFGPDIYKQESYQFFKDKHHVWIYDYALYKTLKIQHQWKGWEEWQDQYKNYSPDIWQHLEKGWLDEIEYHIFIQYLCFEQFEEVKRMAESHQVYLMGDIPILINRDSADVWAYRRFFNLDFAVGAPPDMYAAEGQKWGFPLYNWDALAAENYAWWIQRFEVAKLFYDIFRIDHIVGFFRLWGIPLSKLPIEGSYIPADERLWIPLGAGLMRMMLSHCNMLPVGEDLGVVPTEFRKCLRELGISGMKVMRWERRWNTDKEFIDPKEYQPESLTTISTHDSETLAQWWKNQPEEAKLYAKTLGWNYAPQITDEQRSKILKISHHSGSLFHINLLQEYLALVPNMTWTNLDDERINTPGTVSPANWSYKFRPSVEEIVNNTLLKQVFANILKG